MEITYEKIILATLRWKAIIWAWKHQELFPEPIDEMEISDLEIIYLALKKEEE